jgi:putative transposase
MADFENKYRGTFRVSSARMPGYNYGSDGDYFVTICSKMRNPYFGQIRITEGMPQMHLSRIGEVATEYWKEIPRHFPFVVLDEFVVMPDHLHGILEINKKKKYDFSICNKFGPQSANLGSIIRGYKAAVKTFAVKNQIEFAWQG